MSPAVSVAANLSPTTRQAIGMGVVARTAPISHIAATHQVGVAEMRDVMSDRTLGAH